MINQLGRVVQDVQSWVGITQAASTKFEFRCERKKEIAFNSFCLQYDYWMIVKVQRKLPAKMLSNKRKRNPD